MTYDSAAHEVCPCAACGERRDRVCFTSQMKEHDDNGHGPCRDPQRLGCTCTGTAWDGECEGCWMWLK